MDLIPVRKKVGNSYVGYFYDRMSGKLFGSQNPEHALIAGPLKTENEATKEWVEEQLPTKTSQLTNDGSNGIPYASSLRITTNERWECLWDGIKLYRMPGDVDHSRRQYISMIVPM